MKQLDIQHVATSTVLPDPDNVKRHNEVNLAQIKASITRFGFLDPLGVVDHPDEDGAFMIVEGHGRLSAAEELNIETVPVIVLQLDEAKRRGYGIAHNQIQQMTPMDLSAVSDEFDRIGVGRDDYTSLGFSEEDALFLPRAGGSTGIVNGDNATPTGEASEVGFDAHGQNKAAWTGFVPTIHRTNLQFSNDTNYTRFVELLGVLRGKYPTEPSISARIAKFIEDGGTVSREINDGATT